jgi:hypothetical protein
MKEKKERRKKDGKKTIAKKSVRKLRAKCRKRLAGFKVGPSQKAARPISRTRK